MSNNRASRKGIGQTWSDYDRVLKVLTSVGVKVGESVIDRHERRRDALPRDARKRISFQTTSLIFSGTGEYLGTEYMARDECDYFERGKHNERRRDQSTVEQGGILDAAESDSTTT